MKSRLIALVNVVVYAIFMVLCVLLGNSGKKQRNENNNATKSKLQKQDTVVGVVISVMFPKRRDTEMVKAIVSTTHGGTMLLFHLEQKLGMKLRSCCIRDTSSTPPSGMIH